MTAPKPAPEPRECALETCGRTFTPNKVGHPQLYCDVKCRAKAHKLKHRAK